MQDGVDEISQNDSLMDEEMLGHEPNLDHQFNKAKAFLQKPSVFTGDNLFDHLSDLLNKILSERPQNIIDFFEDYSRKVKECRYRDATDHLRDIYAEKQEVESSIKLKPLINPLHVVDFEESSEESDESSQVDVLDSFHLLAEAGITIPKCDMYILQLSLRKLIQSEPIKNLRFWGKIFGLDADYYIAEAELSEEGITRLEAEEEEEEAELEEESEEIVMEEEGGEDVPKIPRKKPPIPKLIKIEEKVVPCERFAQGANKKLYYVCHEPGIDPWVKLPDVTPQQITASRKIVKYFTGNLEHPLETWPPFPGVEKNYLRAQIGRISAGTSVAPVGLYTFFPSEEEEDFNDEEDGVRTEIFLNSNYEKVNIRDLNDGTLSFWVHTALYILPQGRCIWWNPNQSKGEENEEDEDAGEEMIDAETGPVLLSPLTNDASLESIPPWTVRLTTALIPEKACAYIRSNLWPGAYTVTSEDKCVYIYMGTGHKYTAYNYSPPPLPAVLREYPIGPEILEMQDPSGAQEEAWRIAHEKHPPAEEEQVETEDDEEDDDDDLI